MWYPIRDYTLDEAQRFLREDFLQVLRRVRLLYVDTRLPPDIGPGYFEPILLCACWCDFLGALYSGNATNGNAYRIKTFLDSVLSEINPRYREVSGSFVKVYRHSTVHAYAPAALFRIAISQKDQHLILDGSMLGISIAHLVDDMIRAVEIFATQLGEGEVDRIGEGSLAAFNKARGQLG